MEAERAILDVTMELLATEGYRLLTLDKVASLARVSKSTMYRRWPSKEHLVIAAFDQSPPLVPKGKGKVLDEVLDILSQFVDIMHSTPLAGVLPTLVGERAHNHALAQALDPVIERRRAPIKEILKRAIDKGELPKSIDMELAVDAIMGPILLRLFFLQGDLSKKTMRDLLKVVLRGLGAAV